jgi:Protein of unknown function (DUF3175)
MRKKAKNKKRWVAKVKTESTHPQKGLFNQSALTVARSLASKRVSPKGAPSGLRMLTYYINRAGRKLKPSRRRELERAKSLLSKRAQRGRSAKKSNARGHQLVMRVKLRPGKFWRREAESNRR